MDFTKAPFANALPGTTSEQKLGGGTRGEGQENAAKSMHKAKPDSGNDDRQIPTVQRNFCHKL